MPAAVPHTEKKLFTLIAGGDETAFHELFTLYRGKVYAAVFHLTKSPFIAEELTQEVFIGLWVSRKGLSNVEDPAAYIYRVIYNKINNFFIKESNEARVLAAYREHGATFSNETEETIVFNESRQLLGEAIEQLSPQKKVIYKMSREQGMSYEQIAQALQISPNTVKNHLVEATKIIRQYLNNTALSAAIAEVLTHIFW